MVIGIIHVLQILDGMLQKALALNMMPYASQCFYWPCQQVKPSVVWHPVKHRPLQAYSTQLAQKDNTLGPFTHCTVGYVLPARMLICVAMPQAMSAPVCLGHPYAGPTLCLGYPDSQLGLNCDLRLDPRLTQTQPLSCAGS